MNLILSVFLTLPFMISSNLNASDSKKRSIIDALGNKLEIPMEPKRVIALSEFDLDASLALNIVPIGTVNGRGQNSSPRYLGKKANKIPIVGNIHSPIMGKIIEKKPDLILFGGITDKNILKQLNMIAPTVVTFNYKENWKTAFINFSKYLGKEKSAENFLKSYKNKINSVKNKIGKNQGSTVSIVRWNPKGPAYMLEQSFSRLVLNDLQFARPNHQSGKGISHSKPLSLEDLNLIDGDWIFLGTLSSIGKATKSMNQTLNTPSFKRLKAVQNKKAITIDGSLWTSLGGPLAALKIIDDIEKTMAVQ